MIGQKSKIKNFWIIFFGTVALLAVAAAIALGCIYSRKVAQMRMSQVNDDNVYKIDRENTYKRSLYALCDSLKNIDADLCKTAVSNNAEQQAQMLTAVVIHANAVNQNLSELPFATSDNLAACQRFVNQTQDYATYLVGKLALGKPLQARERAALLQLDTVANNLYAFVSDYARGDAGMFVTNGNGLHNVGALSDGLEQVDSNAFTYEKLIYDGPFSESVAHKTLQLSAKLSHEQCGNTVTELFGDNVFCCEVSNNGLYYVYNLPDGKVMLTADGRVAQYERYLADYDNASDGDNGDSAHGNDTAKVNAAHNADYQSIAQQFCLRLGYDVTPVWVSRTQDDVIYVNCATVIDGVIVYPDLVKIAVDRASGLVVGCEAKAYLLNHTDWDVTFGDVSQDDAARALDGSLTVTNTARALIEKNGKLYACYEYECSCADRQYYVYVDSVTGNEVELFKVIAQTEGHTVM